MKYIFLFISIILSVLPTKSIKNYRTIDKNTEEWLKKSIRRNLTMFNTINYYGKNKDKLGFSQIFSDNYNLPFPIPDKGWYIDLKIKPLDNFSDFLSDSSKIIAWEWPSCRLRSIIDSSTVTFVNINYLSHLNENGCVLFRNGKLYFIGGESYLDNNLKDVFIKNSLSFDEKLAKALVHLKYYQYFPSSITIDDLNDSSAIFSFVSSSRYKTKIVDKIYFKNGFLK